MRKIDENNKN